MEIQINKLKAIKGIGSSTRTTAIARKLSEISSLAAGKIYVHPREINFKNMAMRRKYFHDHAEVLGDEAEVVNGLSSEMMKNLHAHGSIFLINNKPPVGNQYTVQYRQARTMKAKQKVAEQNKNQILSWHSMVLVYIDRKLLIMDPNFDPTNRPYAISQLPFRSKVLDFLSLIKNKRPVDLIAIGGGGNTKSGKCRTLCFEFIKKVVISKVCNESYAGTKFFEITRQLNKSGISEEKKKAMRIIGHF